MHTISCNLGLVCVMFLRYNHFPPLMPLPCVHKFSVHIWHTSYSMCIFRTLMLCTHDVSQAYVDAIARAHHYVHIEQQFFISGTAGGGVRNRVAAALVARVERAVRERAPFRINVVMPLLPSFPGTPQQDFTVPIYGDAKSCLCAFFKIFHSVTRRCEHMTCLHAV
jgi:hypothetical protein